MINKISFFELTTCSQSGRGEVGMFILSIRCMKESPTSKNMILRKGKKSMKGEFKWNFERLKSDFCWISNHLKIKVYFSFQTSLFVKYFEINIILLDWEIIWSRLINIWEVWVRIPSKPLFFFKAWWKSSNGEIRPSLEQTSKKTKTKQKNKESKKEVGAFSTVVNVRTG